MANAMMSIPVLVDGLSRERIEIVDRALLLHERVFRRQFILNLIRGNAVLVEEHISKMAILFESILNCSRNSKRNPLFVQNLITVTLEHLKLLLNILEGTDSRSSIQEQRKAVQELFSFYFSELNTILTKICSIHGLSKTVKIMDRRDAELVTGDAVPVTVIHSNSSDKRDLDHWSLMTDEEVVRDALQNRTSVADALQVLKSRGNRPTDEVKRYVMSVADSYIFELLQKRKIDSVKEIIQHIEKDVWPTLKDICLKTLDAALRDYLALELKYLGLLDDVEQDTWKYLILVEGVLRNTNLKVTSDGMKLKIMKEELTEESESHGKMSLSISQLLALSSETDIKSEFLMELYFETQDRTLEAMLEKENCWKFLLSSNRLDDLFCWICATKDPSNTEICSKKRQQSFLSSWVITQEMVDYITKSKCHIFTRERLLDFLSRYDIYTTEESGNVHKLLLREARNGQLSNTLKDRIKLHLVKFTLEHNFPELLISCKVTVEEGLSPWTDLYLKYLDGLESQSGETLLKCIIEAAQFLNLSTSTDQWIPLTSVILSSQDLKDVFRQESSMTFHIPNFVISKSDLLRSLELHPRLKSILSMPPSENLAEDISALQLLQYSGLSGIQLEKSLCSLFRSGRDEIVHSFTDHNLISLYGYNEMLDYHYYLKQGRPCFAASVVLADQILNFGGPSGKLLKKACMSAHGLAISHFTNQKTTASCIAFIEMLGGASVALRCHIAAAKILYDSDDYTNDSAKGYNNIVLLLKGLSSEDHARKAHTVLKLLHRQLQQDVLAHGLVIELADLHQLPYPRSFLSHCARNDDWMKFLLFCHLYNAPRSVVRSLVKQFKSVSLRKHFELCFHCCQAVSKSPPNRTPAETSTEQSAPKAVKQEVFDLRLKSNGATKDTHLPGHKDQSQIPLSNFTENLLHCDDLFGVLWMCHQSADPHAALLSACLNLPCPILAVIADYYQPNPLSHFCIWLASWLPREERTNKMLLQESMQPSLEEVEHVIFLSLVTGCANLYVAFNTFLPEHPLLLPVQVILNFSYDTALNNLIVFQEACQSICLKTETEAASAVLGDGSYILSLGEQILFRSLESSILSATEKFYLIIALLETNFFFGLKERKSDLKLLQDIMSILSVSDVQVDIRCYFHDTLKEVVHCIDELISMEDFQLAKQVANVAGVKNSFIVIAEETKKFYAWLENHCQDFKSLCLHFNNVFEEEEVDPAAAFQFFDLCVQKLTNNGDRWRALRSCYQWLSVCTSCCEEQTIQLEKLEIDIWECCLNEKCHSFSRFLDGQLNCTPLSMLCGEALGINIQTSKKKSSHFMSQSNQTVRLLELISYLLDIGDIASAFRLKFLFGASTMDLEILAACISLAEEKLAPNGVLTACQTMSSLNLIDSNNQLSQLDFYLDQAEKSFVSDTKEANFTLNMGTSSKTAPISCALKGLCKHLKHGKEIGKQLIACYELSVSLNLSYKDVSSVTDPLKLLRIALSENCLNHYTVASDVMTALKLTPYKCAEFLSREIVAALSKGYSQGHARDCKMWGCSIETHFSRLLEHVPDPCLLGNELMCFATRLTASDQKPTKEVISTTVELLVRAHDCYSARCHMEGIVYVLRTVNKVVLVLKSLSEWALMVRLLTGIQRYTEMSYIFQILKENDQFEFLLRKDSVKPAGFKSALLEWLRRQCPDDPSLLKMTTAYFKMHKEEAALWAAEGKKRLQDLVQGSLQNTFQSKVTLQTALQDFSHAAECYLQADLFNHAMFSAHQAELIALQLHILSLSSEKQMQCILLLDSKSVAKLITSSLSFHQAQIVARAYNHRVDWGAALFYHCISPGSRSEEYFSAWSAAMELTPALIQDIAHRFQRSSIATREMAANMRVLLSHVQDVDVRYRIASELGFKDFVEDLLQAPEVVFLKDTVWQSGFKVQ